MVQMANLFGARTLFNRVRRGFRRPGFFEVRAYTPWKLRREFQTRIGPTAMSVDCYFGLGIQPADADLMPLFERTVIFASEVLRRLSTASPPLNGQGPELVHRARIVTVRRSSAAGVARCGRSTVAWQLI